MKMMGIGNEQWGPDYLERLAAFTKAIKDLHPEITLVSDSGPSPSDERFDFLWPRLKQMGAEMVDQHCYANPIWFLSNTHRYDDYDRSGPKVFFGEYAAQSVAIVSTKNRNNLECALAEAAFMTGLERNADVVRMASYAPLFANTEAWQWTPNLIWVNSLQTMATPNYYVQSMYMHHRGDQVLPVTNTAPVREILPAGRVAVGTNKASAEFKDVRVVATENSSRVLLDAPLNASASGWTGGGNWRVTDGAYRQTDRNAIATSLAGQRDWRSYTVSLKARKLDGAGSVVMTVYDDGAGAWAQWILGGWDNSQHGILTHYAEQDQLLERVPGSLENNRWYDVKIVLNGAKMDCYLDGQLVQSARILEHRIPAVFATAARDQRSGEVILKLVNPGDQASPVTIQLDGAGRVASTGQQIVLSGSGPADENTIGQPPAIAPEQSELRGVKSSFRYTLKPYSFTVLRLGADAAAPRSAAAR
jgi:alpha-L-arabinofuranosidase